MSKVRIKPGVRFRLKGEWFIVRELLLNRQILVESHSLGGKSTKSFEELIGALSNGELQFETIGPHRKLENNDNNLSSDYKIKDFEALPEYVREEAWRVYQLLLPILRWKPEERNRLNIEKYVEELRSKQGIISQKVKNEAPRKGIKKGQALSRSFLERKLKAYLNSGSDIRSLVDENINSGNPGVHRLDKNIDNVISNVLDEYEMTRQHRTVESVYESVVNAIDKANKFLEPGMKLRLPSKDTVYRRIYERGSANILGRSKSRVEQHANNPVSFSPQVTRIMELVEMDGTWLDIIAVDEDDRLPIGRPWFSIARDKYSNLPLGFYLGFDAPSYLTTMRCALHAFSPKPDSRTLYGTKNNWTYCGIPEWVLIDNGKEYANTHLDSAFGMIGIPYRQSPVKSPWTKGSIERFIRTQDTSLIHMLPGTTFSNIVSRGDYPSAKFACISLSGLTKILHIFLLDYISQKWNKGVKGIPAQLWRQNEKEGFIPTLPSNLQEMQLLLYMSEKRTLQRVGIEYETIIYQSDDLLRMRTLLSREDREVNIRVNPEDLSHIYVLDPMTGQDWLRFTANDSKGYTNGLSLWKHRMILRVLNQQKREVDIFGLADAKSRIQQIVEEEYSLKKKLRNRKSTARFLSLPPLSNLPEKISSSGKILAPEIDDSISSAQINIENTILDLSMLPTMLPKKKVEDTPAPSTATRISPQDLNEEIDNPGWISDFNLPQQKNESN